MWSTPESCNLIGKTHLKGKGKILARYSVLNNPKFTIENCLYKIANNNDTVKLILSVKLPKLYTGWVALP